MAARTTINSSHSPPAVSSPTTLSEARSRSASSPMPAVKRSAPASRRKKPARSASTARMFRAIAHPEVAATGRSLAVEVGCAVLGEGGEALGIVAGGVELVAQAHDDLAGAVRWQAGG